MTDDQPFLLDEIDQAEAIRMTLERKGNPFEGGNRYEILDYLHTLYALIEKEQIIHTRLSLFKDEEWAKDALEHMDNRRKAADLYPEQPLGAFFTSIKTQVGEFINDLENDPKDLPPFDDLFFG